LISRPTEVLEAEKLTLKLLARGMGQRSLRAASSGNRSQKLVNQAKVVISEGLGRRWTLAEVADLVGVSPVISPKYFNGWKACRCISTNYN
jgi:hypothetical protein